MVIQLSHAHVLLVKRVLRQHVNDQKAYVFGSRAQGSALKFSDVDICLVGEELTFIQMSNLKDAFSESDLPYFVDVIQKDAISASFYTQIESDFIELIL